MPFPVDLNFIRVEEKKLGVALPEVLVEFLQSSNGGEFETEEDDWTLFSVTDFSDRKRLKRSWNSIADNTASAREWSGFPLDAVAIASNGCGDYLVLIPEENHSGRLDKTPVFWNHKTGILQPLSLELVDILSPA